MAEQTHMTLTRRTLLTGASALALAGAARAAGATTTGAPFDRDTVIEMARDLAARRHAPRPMVPEAWRNLTYDQYRDIRHRKSDALWAGTTSPYEVDFFAPGLYFPRAVQVFAVEEGQARPVPFDLDEFDKGPLVPELPREGNLGYSGIRLRTDLDVPGKKTEYAVFQGASYFRAIALGLAYGLSARGLAIGTGSPEGEEFPDFTTFWLERPAEGARNMVVHALMDSPSVAGAYRFDISPGESAIMEVEATLFPRVEIDQVGIAPLTSMFLFDLTSHARFDDFRPAVHDSDGLLIWNGNGEVLWRALANPRHLQISSFVDTNPRGFGLMQRARKLTDFNDLEAHYHRRPGLWVEPRGAWGRGVVKLVEIPADKEIYDNIVAAWRPADPLPAGGRVDLAYRLTWGAEAPIETGLARVVDSAMGLRPFGPGRVAVIDFEAHPLFDDGPGALTIHVQSPHVETSPGILEPNPATGGLRLAFTFDPGDLQAVELRAQLRRDGAMASEVWLYRWTA
jgi:glucans biosynthesis protein